MLENHGCQPIFRGRTNVGLHIQSYCLPRVGVNGEAITNVVGLKVGHTLVHPLDPQSNPDVTNI